MCIVAVGGLLAFIGLGFREDIASIRSDAATVADGLASFKTQTVKDLGQIDKSIGMLQVEIRATNQRLDTVISRLPQRP